MGKISVIVLILLLNLFSCESVQDNAPVISIVEQNVVLDNGVDKTFHVKVSGSDRSGYTYNWYINNYLQSSEETFTFSAISPTKREVTLKVEVSNGNSTAVAETTITVLAPVADAVSFTASVPDGYYETAIAYSGDTLKTELHKIISNEDKLTRYSYSGCWDQLCYTDEDPDNSDNVILLYTGWSYDKDNHGKGVANEWNREHTWAKSHGDFGTDTGAGTDLHHLRPADSSVNSARSNLDFDNGGNTYYDSSRENLTGSFDTGCKKDGDSWEPRDEVKGDVARMMFYMAVMYEGDGPGVYDIYDLELSDMVGNGANPYIGKKSVLLKWNEDDPVSVDEIRRNNRIYERQGNRNPFIDNPGWANSIWK